MRLIDAQVKLFALNMPVIQTSDASACLKITRAHASQILVRLAKAGVVIHIDKGLWALGDKIDPFILPEALTAPYPCYISLQTALYFHGMISQIPQVIYAVSLARTQKFKTSLSDISIHHIDPSFFLGYEVVQNSNIKIACPEKALLDVFYLHSARSMLFKSLPELEIPVNFDFKKAFAMIKLIPSLRVRTIVTTRLTEVSDST